MRRSILGRLLTSMVSHVGLTVRRKDPFNFVVMSATPFKFAVDADDACRRPKLEESMFRKEGMPYASQTQSDQTETRPQCHTHMLPIGLRIGRIIGVSSREVY